MNGNEMIVLLSGCAAEKIAFEHLSTGAADDLQKVTGIARDDGALWHERPTGPRRL